MALSASDFTTINPTTLTTPRSGAIVQVYRDFWWAVDKHGNIAFYKDKHPQCNQNRTIAEKVGPNWPAYAGVICIPVIYLPVNPRDY